MKRGFGYLYTGFSSGVWWWEILVKRVDTLVVLTITYTNLVMDVRGKLTFYGIWAGVLWAAQAGKRPFDGRRAGLLGLRCQRQMTFLRAEASPLKFAYNLTACGGLKRLLLRRVYGLAASVASR